MMSDRATAAAEGFLNHYIKQSTAAGEQLRALAGRSLVVDVRGFGLALRFDAEEERIRVSRVTGGFIDAATATIRARPLSLLRLLRASTAGDFRASTAEIEGDAETAEAFARLLRMAHPELEEELSRIVGDVLANEIAVSVRGFAAWGEHALDALAMNTSEFLQEEVRQLPPRLEVESFSREVERLREDTDRASQRVDRLLEAATGRAAWDASD